VRAKPSADDLRGVLKEIAKSCDEAANLAVALSSGEIRRQRETLDAIEAAQLYQRKFWDDYVVLQQYHRPRRYALHWEEGFRHDIEYCAHDLGQIRLLLLDIGKHESERRRLLRQW
jgi:hypothetical protein